MPIIRVHGWGARCKKCGQLVELGEGYLAWLDHQDGGDGREEVRLSLDMGPGDKLEESISRACGCERTKEKP
ncbi:MAG: hypothetical protein A2Y38_22325 [Spirochaetes bacterium GWB1_59_5]|nr:MAG: hypothetical protein A2Y38_22325 [Spirochaetes bacterium GWB1_59_5]